MPESLVKALVQVDFPIYAQAKSLFKSKQKKVANFTKLLFCQKTFFGIKLFSSCKGSTSLYCVGKALNCFGTSCGTSLIPRICSYALPIHMPYKIAKLDKQPLC